MIWEDIKGEILTFEDTEACAQELVKRRGAYEQKPDTRLLCKDLCQAPL